MGPVWSYCRRGNVQLCIQFRLVVSHLENKLKPKKLKQNQNSSKKLPKNSKKSSKNSIYRKFHIRYSGQNFPNGMKGQFSTHFFPQTQGFSWQLKYFLEKIQGFWGKTQGISAKTQFTGKLIPLCSHILCETTSLN